MVNAIKASAIIVLLCLSFLIAAPRVYASPENLPLLVKVGKTKITIAESGIKITKGVKSIQQENLKNTIKLGIKKIKKTIEKVKRKLHEYKTKKLKQKLKKLKQTLLVLKQILKAYKFTKSNSPQLVKTLLSKLSNKSISCNLSPPLITSDSIAVIQSPDSKQYIAQINWSGIPQDCNGAKSSSSKCGYIQAYSSKGVSLIPFKVSDNNNLSLSLTEKHLNLPQNLFVLYYKQKNGKLTLSCVDYGGQYVFTNSSSNSSDSSDPTGSDGTNSSIVSPVIENVSPSAFVSSSGWEKITITGNNFYPKSDENIQTKLFLYSNLTKPLEYPFTYLSNSKLVFFLPPNLPALTVTVLIVNFSKDNNIYSQKASAAIQVSDNSSNSNNSSEDSSNNSNNSDNSDNSSGSNNGSGDNNSGGNSSSGSGDQGSNSGDTNLPPPTPTIDGATPQTFQSDPNSPQIVYISGSNFYDSNPIFNDIVTTLKISYASDPLNQINTTFTLLSSSLLSFSLPPIANDDTITVTIQNKDLTNGKLSDVASINLTVYGYTNDTESTASGSTVTQLVVGAPYFSDDLFSKPQNRSEVVSLGIPLPKPTGSTKGIAVDSQTGRPALTIVDQSGNVVPFQASAVKYFYDTPSYVEIAEISFLAQENSTYKILSSGNGISSNSNIAISDSSKINISTGPLVTSIDLSPSTNTLFNNVFINGKLGFAKATFDYRDKNNSPLNVIFSTPTVEENGPVRAIIKWNFSVQDSSNNKILTGYLRAFFEKDSPYLILDQIVTVDALNNPHHTIVSRARIDFVTPSNPLLSGSAEFLNSSAEAVTVPIAYGEQAWQENLATSYAISMGSNGSGSPIELAQGGSCKFASCLQGNVIYKKDSNGQTDVLSSEKSDYTPAKFTIARYTEDNTSKQLVCERCKFLAPTFLGVNRGSTSAALSVDLAYGKVAPHTYTAFATYRHKIAFSSQSSTRSPVDVSLKITRPLVAIANDIKWYRLLERYLGSAPSNLTDMSQVFSLYNIPSQPAQTMASGQDRYDYYIYGEQGGGANNQDLGVRYLYQCGIYKIFSQCLKAIWRAMYKAERQLEYTPGYDLANAPTIVNDGAPHVLSGAQQPISHRRIMDPLVIFILLTGDSSYAKEMMQEDFEWLIKTPLNTHVRPLAMTIRNLLMYFEWFKGSSKSAQIYNKLMNEGFVNELVYKLNNNFSTTGWQDEVGGSLASSVGDIRIHPSGVPETSNPADTRTFIAIFTTRALRMLARSFADVNATVSNDALMRFFEAALFLSNWTYGINPKNGLDMLSYAVNVADKSILSFPSGFDHLIFTEVAAALDIASKTNLPTLANIFNSALQREIWALYKGNQLQNLQDKPQFTTGVYYLLNGLDWL